ncbi:MAG: hypothetical protein LBC68_07340 [Prevotellaceae bacterium]|nr:hypothetical protein [Prevotellaceae bacterium]
MILRRANTRGAATVFQVTDSNPRERLEYYLFLPAFHFYETSIFKSLNS